MMPARNAAATEGKCDWKWHSPGPWEERSQTMGQHRLAVRKDKDCDWRPPQYEDVQHMNEGRPGGMPRELAPMTIMLAESP
jgi:hypothetical protein